MLSFNRIKSARRKMRLLQTASFAVTVLFGCLLTCAIVRDNPLDEDGINFEVPEIEYNTSGIQPGDTIHYDTATIVVSGNREECRFRRLRDDSTWTDWSEDAAEAYFLRSLDEGKHVVAIQIHYFGGSVISDTSITFYVSTNGYKPSFFPETDTTITVQPGNAISLYSSVSGLAPYTFSWRKNSEEMEEQFSDTLIMANVDSSDAGTYLCTATNDYGTATSREYILIVQSSEGFRVRYHPNGADSGRVPVDDNLYYTGNKFFLPGNIGDLAKSGYEFAGWSLSADDTDVPFAAGSGMRMDTADILLYACWTKDTMFSVSYNENDASSGTAPVDNNRYLAGSGVTILQNSGNLQKGDSIFAGWMRGSGSEGNVYLPGDTLRIGEMNCTLYVYWGAQSRYRITYLPNGADDGSAPEDDSLYASGSVVTVPDRGTLEYSGYAFTGWCRESSCEVDKYGVDDTLIIGRDSVALYACWSKQPTYTITYDASTADNGSVPIDPNRYLSGEVATVRGNTGELEKDGFVFIGWGIQPDDTVLLQKNDGLKIGSEDITLFAIWSSNPTYTISYKGNNHTAGDPPADPANYLEDASVTIHGKGSLVKTGYTFIGWNSDSAGNGDDYSPEEGIRMPSNNLVLYAQWEINVYTVIFISQDNRLFEQPADSGSLLTVPSEPTRTGYEFIGWYKERNGINVWDFENDRVSDDDSLFAQWAPIMYGIVFRSQGGSTLEDTSVQHGMAVTMPSPSPVRDGYTFNGWYTDAACTDAWDFDEEHVFADDTLYAGWVQSIYTVYFNTQGGNDIDSVTVDHGSLFAAPDPEPVRTGYSFEGWFTEAGCVNAWDFASEVAVEDDTLYAKWEVLTYTVTFNTQGGSTVDPVEANHGSVIEAPSTEPVRDGYSFEGWYKEPECSNEWVFSTDVILSDDTLYARWTEEIDPKTHFKIFLCFGQSNMSGGAGVEPGETDADIHSRVMTLAFNDCDDLSWEKDQWYSAREPLHCGDGINAMGPAYAFGKVMADSLPEDTIGLIPCGQWGVSIEHFMKGGTNKGATQPAYPGSDAYGWMLGRIQLAMERGVFSGIIMHQGESNSGDPDWLSNVKIVYDDLITDLGLTGNIPFVAGELLHSGCCDGHNSVIAQIPEQLPMGYVASAEDLEGGGTYPSIHFNQAGYRELGKRFAIQMLEGLRSMP